MSKVDVTVQQYLRSRLPLDAKFGPYATIAARNLIPAEDRYPMMVVGVEDTDGFGTNAIYFLKDGVTNSDWELIAFGSGQSYQPQEQTWVWSDGIDAGGVHLDFVIPGAIAGEVASIDSCILFVGGSVQRNTTDFELQTTTVLNDTIRILNTTAAEREATVTVQLWYNRVGEGIPLPTVLFTQLQDVPSSYVGQAGKFVSVKGTEDALEFIDIVLPSKNIPAFTTAINKTISGGVLAIGDDRHIIVNAESGTVDDLTEITGTNLEEGDVISITVAAGDTITAFSEWSPSAYQLKLQIDRQFILRAGFTYEFILEDLSLGLTWVQLNDPSFTKYPAFQNLQNRTIDDSGGQLSISSNGRRIAVASWDGSTVQDLTELNTSQYNEGEIILLTAQTGETITVKHNATAGGFKLIGGQDVILDEINPLMLMKHSDGYWHQLNNLSDIKGSQIEIGGQAKGGSSIISYTAAASFNMNDGNMQKMILTGNVTSLALTNKVNGSSYRIILEQGASGSYTVPAAGATFGTRTDNSVDDSGGAGSWEPTAVGTRMIYDITVEPDGDTFYSIETIGVV